MSENHSKLQKLQELRSVRLSSDVRERMRAELKEHANFHTADESVPGAVAPAQPTTRSWWQRLAYGPLPYAALAIMLVLSGAAVLNNDPTVPTPKELPAPAFIEESMMADDSADSEMNYDQRTMSTMMAEPEAVDEDAVMSDVGKGSELISVTYPTPGAMINNPVIVTGEARGYWFFEASAPVTVVNWDGLIIGEGYITAEGNWMTEDFVPFTGTISYELPVDSYSASGTVIFRRDNPSGLPENDAFVEIPVMLTPVE